MLFDVFLVADSCDEPYFLVGEGFSALFEHVRVSDVEAVVDAVGVDPEHFFSHNMLL